MTDTRDHKLPAYSVVYDYSDAPTLKQFALSNARIRLIIGPFGSGKSSACVMEIIRRGHEQAPSSDGIRRTRWAVVRNCFDDKTEVLTEKRGWQLFKNLLPDDKVASLVKGRELVFVKPLNYYEYQYDDVMIGYSNRNLDFLVTPEHNLYASMINGRTKEMYGYKFHKAEDVYGMTHYRFKTNADEYKGGYSEFSERMFEFFGFWFAEGYVGKYPRKDTPGYHWRFTVTQKDNAEYVAKLLSDCGFKYGKNKGGGSAYNYSIYINDDIKLLIEKLLPCGKSTTKYLPDWIKSAPRGHLKAFLKGFEEGDGHTRTNKNDSTRLFTSSEKLANDLQEIIFKSGGSASLNKNLSRFNKKSFKGQGFMYVLTIHQPNQYKPQTTKKADWYKKQYKGKVYCVEVPSHVIAIRRNGIISMNSQSYNQLKDTTIKTFLDWFPDKVFGNYRITDHSYLITAFPGVQIEVLFRALDRPDQVSNLLSLELTGAWFNEAREIPKAIIEAMDGRIDRYPAVKDGGCTWTGIIMDTNPPDDDSYLYKMFEVVRPEGWEVFKQPSGLSAQAENTKHLAKNYYVNLARGKDEMYIRVYIHGQYGFMLTGKPVFTNYSDSVHCAKRILEPIKGLPLIVGMDFGLCYDDQTEVLTKAGWKFFKDVTDNDFVMTKDFKTNIIEYHKPLKRIGRMQIGDMYLYENHNVNFCVTPEHIIPCRKRYGKHGFNGDHRLSAEYLYNNISKHYAVDLRAKWNGNSEGTFGPLKWTASVFAEFMGLYLSEGSCDRKHSRINIAQDKKDITMQCILDNTGLRWVRAEKSWRVTDKQLNGYLKGFGYSYEKRVPDEIKNMNSEDILKFIYAYTKGDGHIRTRANGSVEHTIFTISKNMADDFQELALKVGWHAKIRIVKPQDSLIMENGKSRLIHNEGGYSVTFKKRKGTYSELVKGKFSKIQYSGMVYCLTVPHGTLYVRRKYTPSWNGNTPACTIGQITPFGQLRILDELVSDGMAIKQFAINQLLPLLRSKYWGFDIAGYGDPAGSARSQTDESTCFDVLHSSEIGLQNVISAPTNSIVARVSAVDNFLCKMVNGEPGFLLSPNCRYLRKAMNGDYHYALEKSFRGGQQEAKDMPVKNFSSHICLSGDTMVLTPYGNRRIDSIKSGDEVVTPYGNRKVLASGKTAINTKVMQIKLSNGVTLKCTPDHQFPTQNKGIVSCNTLEYGDVLQSYNTWRTLAWSIRSLLSSREGNTGFRQEIITEQKTGERQRATCTERSGKAIMGARFQPGMPSTISMAMFSTMTFPILNWFLYQSMPAIISRRESQMEHGTTENHLRRLGKVQKHGMDHQKDSHGIARTEGKPGKTESFIRLLAKFAERNLKHFFQTRQHSVASTVNQQQGDDPVKTTFKDRVLFVAQTLRRVNIRKLKTAPKIVQISPCLKTEDVYNITVEHDHVYYANGILTCNCDSCEYLCLYIDEKQEYDKQKKALLSRLNQRAHHPASRIGGY